MELGEQELLGSWPEKWRPEHGELLEEQDVPLLEWAFVMLLLEEQARGHGESGLGGRQEDGSCGARQAGQG